MFETIFEQPAVHQLSADRAGGVLAPSMLFSGSPGSGKGTAGLELARILSCENPTSPANCSCSACIRHQMLTHPDVLMLGSRAFFAEISAAAAACVRKPEAESSKLFFIRSVRKLLARFSPILWEDEPKFGKLSDSILALDEALDEIWNSNNVPKTGKDTTPEALKKRYDALLKTALKLESEGISDQIPIGHIRRAAAWSHLAPVGKGKFLLIENADRMQDSARNSLLKILEEPPESVTIVLTTSREEALLPTILSRLRPYRFIHRSRAVEAEVIRRVFNDEQVSENSENRSGISAYLDSFLPIPGEALRPLAAYFASSIALGTILTLKKQGLRSLPDILVTLGKYTTPLAEAVGLGRPSKDTQIVITKIVAGAEKFEIRGLFPQFLSTLLSLISESSAVLRQHGAPTAAIHAYNDIWRKYTGEAATAVNIYNQSPSLALERLSTELRRALAVQFSRL
jgi:DNA polymerase-3 subunit gamma/tau